MSHTQSHPFSLLFVWVATIPCQYHINPYLVRMHTLHQRYVTIQLTFMTHFNYTTPHHLTLKSIIKKKLDIALKF